MAKGKDLSVLELVGSSKSGFEVVVNLDSTTALINKVADQFIKRAIQRINAKGSGDTGAMEDIQVVAISKNGNITDIDVGYNTNNPAKEYWKFQNYGVQGLDSGRPSASPYKFKKYTVGGEFLQRLIEWYTRHKNYFDNDDQKTRLTKRQKKSKSLGNIAQNKIKGIAYVTGKKIKREGLKALGFREYALENSFNDEFYKKLSKALGRDIIVHIRKNDFE
jgi:hypothetical protein